MSVILVKKEKDRIIIGADSQQTGQNHQENILDAKLREIEPGVYLAGAGDAHVCSILYAYAEKHSLLEINSAWEMIEYFSKFNSWLTEEIYTEEMEDNKALLGRCQFIIIIKNRVWQFTDFYTREINAGECNSIGSGSQAAYAAMTLTKSVKKALEAVCSVDIYCSAPINIKEIKI